MGRAVRLLAAGTTAMLLASGVVLVPTIGSIRFRSAVYAFERSNIVFVMTLAHLAKRSS